MRSTSSIGASSFARPSARTGTRWLTSSPTMCCRGSRDRGQDLARCSALEADGRAFVFLGPSGAASRRSRRVWRSRAACSWVTTTHTSPMGWFARRTDRVASGLSPRIFSVCRPWLPAGPARSRSPSPTASSVARARCRCRRCSWWLTSPATSMFWRIETSPERDAAAQDPTAAGGARSRRRVLASVRSEADDPTRRDAGRSTPALSCEPEAPNSICSSYMRA